MYLNSLMLQFIYYNAYFFVCILNIKCNICNKNETKLYAEDAYFILCLLYLQVHDIQL